MTKRRDSKWTQVYFDGVVFYVRLGRLESDIFPHGISLATTFSTKEFAEKFADEVDMYMYMNEIIKYD